MNITEALQVVVGIGIALDTDVKGESKAIKNSLELATNGVGKVERVDTMMGVMAEGLTHAEKVHDYLEELSGMLQTHGLPYEAVENAKETAASFKALVDVTTNVVARAKEEVAKSRDALKDAEEQFALLVQQSTYCVEMADNLAGALANLD